MIASLPWFAIQTKPRAEKAAAIQLEARGYNVFLPTYRNRNKWSDRITEIVYPLFPGYCFCCFDSTRPARIVSAPGVVRIVGWGSQPEPVPEHEIAAIQTMLRSGFRLQPHKYLREGERIEVTQGPLRGVHGFLIKDKGNMKVVVSVELLQRSVAVELEYEAVRQDSLSLRLPPPYPLHP